MVYVTIKAPFAGTSCTKKRRETETFAPLFFVPSCQRRCPTIRGGWKENAMSQMTQVLVCPPHHWEVTSVRIEGVCHYHHHCIKCQAEKDVPLSASTASKWVSRHSKAKQ